MLKYNTLHDVKDTSHALGNGSYDYYIKRFIKYVKF